MALIDLIRHGATESPGRLLGRTDAAISDDGMRQLARQVQGRSFELIVASPLARSRVPAERIAEERNLVLSVDPDWAELDFGDWDGRLVTELSADPEIAQAMDALYRAPAEWTPGGESWLSMQQRIKRALARLAQHDTETRALVITHAGPIRSAVAIACDIPFEKLWALRVSFATRLTLRIGTQKGGRLWGEIVEIVQP